jgi:DNA processing protein
MPQSSKTYTSPSDVRVVNLSDLISGVRQIPEEQQQRFGILEGGTGGLKLWCAGDLSLVRKTSVAIVGTREVSKDGAARARRLAKELAACGITIVSGLARGVDTEALKAAIESGGKTVAVIGTPIDRAYPAENKRLQEKIYREHLLISQFPPGKKVFPSNFPERNKLMAAISDATVIVEASDTSGTLHQAAECVRLNRLLFIAASIMEDPTLHWPQSFISYPNAKVLRKTSDVLEALGIACPSK